MVQWSHWSRLNDPSVTMWPNESSGRWGFVRSAHAQMFIIKRGDIGVCIPRQRNRREFDEILNIVWGRSAGPVQRYRGFTITATVIGSWFFLNLSVKIYAGAWAGTLWLSQRNWVFCLVTNEAMLHAQKTAKESPFRPFLNVNLLLRAISVSEIEHRECDLPTVVYLTHA